MAESCKKIREKLIDIYCGEEEMTGELERHLESCPQCAAYRESLNTLRVKLPVPEPEGEADERILRNAFREADRRHGERKNLREFGMFLGVAVSILACVVWAASMGYGFVILLAQLGLLLLVPFSVPFFIKRRLSKEGGESI